MKEKSAAHRTTDSQDSDEPAHLRTLARVFPAHI